MQPRPPLLQQKPYNPKTQPCHGSIIWPDLDKTYRLLSKTTITQSNSNKKSLLRWNVTRLISQPKVRQRIRPKIIVTFREDLWPYSNAIHSNKDCPHTARSMSQNLGQAAKKIKWRCSTALKTTVVIISSKNKRWLEIISMKTVSVTVLCHHLWLWWPQKRMEQLTQSELQAIHQMPAHLWQLLISLYHLDCLWEKHKHWVIAIANLTAMTGNSFSVVMPSSGLNTLNTRQIYLWVTLSLWLCTSECSARAETWVMSVKYLWISQGLSPRSPSSEILTAKDAKFWHRYSTHWVSTVQVRDTCKDWTILLPVYTTIVEKFWHSSWPSDFWMTIIWKKFTWASCQGCTCTAKSFVCSSRRNSQICSDTSLRNKSKYSSCAKTGSWHYSHRWSLWIKLSVSLRFSGKMDGW